MFYVTYKNVYSQWVDGRKFLFHVAPLTVLWLPLNLQIATEGVKRPQTVFGTFGQNQVLIRKLD